MVRVGEALHVSGVETPAPLIGEDVLLPPLLTEIGVDRSDSGMLGAVNCGPRMELLHPANRVRRTSLVRDTLGVCEIFGID